MLPIDLHGKICLITGATGQLGRTMARTLARAGAAVVIHYHQNRDFAAQLETELRGIGEPVMTVQADVTNPDSVFAMRDRVAAAFGPPQVIVTNAVAQYHWTSVLEQSPADYESQFRTCVMHNVLMAKAFVPAMIQRRFGRIIAINTECAMQCTPNQSAYVSGKRGMDGVLRVLAREVGPHQITVNQIAPGWMISEKYRGGGERNEGYEKNVPLRHRGEDQDIANLVAYLASDLAAFITGAFIPVCGGNVMPAI